MLNVKIPNIKVLKFPDSQEKKSSRLQPVVMLKTAVLRSIPIHVERV